MNIDQLNQLLDVEIDNPSINISMLEDKSNRTLLWGYTCNRANWHVYIKDENILVYSYDGWNNEFPVYISAINYDPNELIPDKRLYPEACDFEFCRLLKKMGCNLPFTVFNLNREPAQYYGKTF